MSQADKQKREGRLRNLTGAFRKRQEERVEISTFQIGDIRAEKPVIVTAGATLIGDLSAPEVVVKGLVYGYVASQRLAVAPGGQIWGDAYVHTLELAATGKINGWVCTLDAGTVDLLRAKELSRADLPDQDDWRLPAELLEQIMHAGAEVENDQRESQRRSGIWRQLRSEAALALIARSEIEAMLEQQQAEARTVTGPADAEMDEAQAEGETVVTVGGGADDEFEKQAAAEAPSKVGEHERTAELAHLQAQLRQATAAAQKYYGELLWTRAELRAARGEDSEA
jgi:cytoskeletal protein CcmA (bactofilin family)